MSNCNGLDRRRVLAGAAAGAVALMALGTTAAAQESVTWRVQSHWPKASASFDDSLQVLADQLKERTEGRFTLELFGAGEFAKGPEIYNLVRRGVVEMGTTSPSYLQDEAQTYAFAMGIPGSLREEWEMMHYIKNMGVEDLLNQELNPAGVIYFSEKVYPTELVVKQPITSAQDFESLKLRSAGTMMDYLSAVGAAPQMVEGSELYQALSSGVVDGAHWGAAQGAQSMSLWEVAKYHLTPALGITVDAYIVNKDAYEALPDDLRTTFTNLVNERFFLRSTEYQLMEQLALAEGQESQGVEVIELPQDVLDRFTEASQQIIEQESQRGELAQQAADRLRELMTQLGYL
ncbi:TRAP transporter substrate-binding protein DctP [Acuticoccus sp.]|uniref:TRAP transporter substrate-binding protein DctP n=1 Tax=Acuticoccus sp. TaxID=1904378 RepID=UPI003B51E9E0